MNCGIPSIVVYLYASAVATTAAHSTLLAFGIFGCVRGGMGDTVDLTQAIDVFIIHATLHLGSTSTSYIYTFSRISVAFTGIDPNFWSGNRNVEFAIGAYRNDTIEMIRQKLYYADYHHAAGTTARLRRRRHRRRTFHVVLINTYWLIHRICSACSAYVLVQCSLLSTILFLLLSLLLLLFVCRLRINDWQIFTLSYRFAQHSIGVKIMAQQHFIGGFE